MIQLGIGGTGRCAHMVHLPMCGFLSSARSVCFYIGIGWHGGMALDIGLAKALPGVLDDTICV